MTAKYLKSKFSVPVKTRVLYLQLIFIILNNFYCGAQDQDYIPGDPDVEIDLVSIKY